MLVVVCNLTKYVLLRPVVSKSAAVIGSALFLICADFGWPREWQADSEPTLLAVIKVLKDTLRMQHRQTVEYAPRTNSNAETAVKLASSIVHKLVTGPDWDLVAPLAQTIINDRERTDTNRRSPFESMFCRHNSGFHDAALLPPPAPPQVSLDAWAQRLELEKMIERPFMRAYAAWRSSKSMEDFGSRHHVSTEQLAAGSQVMYLDPVRKSKNHPPYLGPFTIVSCDARTGHYTLRDSLNTAKKIRATLDQLKPLPLASPSDAQPDDDSTEDASTDPIYHVERLVGHRKNKAGAYEYSILWTGYDKPSWEKESQIVDKSLITDYWSSKKRIHARRK